MTNGSKPAAPLPDDLLRRGATILAHCGLTKREWFAGLAMQGIWAAPALTGKGSTTQEELAHMAVEQADALLEALAK